MLNAQMTLLQEEERRRIARELHDSVGQLLAAITINNAMVESEAQKLSSDAAKRISENGQMVDEVNKQIRTISFLLHPPLLDEAGLAPALRVYVDGFSKRSRISTDLEITPDLGRFPEKIEISAFRFVQECLTNIHRHSGSMTAAIHVIRDKNILKIKIEDAGRGFSSGMKHTVASMTHAGVGIQGMRERLRHLGGTLQIDSDQTGTRIIAVIPLMPRECPAETKATDACSNPNIVASPI
jgi:signal transduction histidine kinase